MSKRKVTRREKEVINRGKELEYPTDRLGAGSLMTTSSHTNSSRMIMVNNQFPQHVDIENPEMPKVLTGFENVLGSYNHMNDQAEEDYEVVAKFVKNDYNYIIIGFDKKNKRYHAWKREEAEEHSEGFSTRYNNKFIDSLETGDKIESGEYVKKSTSFDKYMNYRYGRNLNTVYMISTSILEDGVLFMNNADRMMNTFMIHEYTIFLADNEILLNLFGDDDHYQGIPLIGEKTKNGFIAAVRRLSNAKAPYSLKKKQLQTMERGDRKYYGEGKVIDIDIRYNKDSSKLSPASAYSVINDLYEKQQQYYHDVYKFMMNIIDHADDDGCTYTDEFSIICSECFDYVDSAAFFADTNENVFGNIQINIKVMEKLKVLIGTKLVGRYGNKGVVSDIYPPENSWHMEDGRPIHCVLATLGIVGRLNQSQMNEHSINELSSTAVEMMKCVDDLNEKAKVVYNLMKFLNSDEADGFMKFFRNLDKEDKKRFCDRIERDGIFIVQDPIDNANIMDIAKAYEKFPANWQHIIFPDGKRSMHKVLCASMFFMRLKQDPIEKFSVRSRGPVNPLNGLPTKSSQKKKGISAFSDVPVRFSELGLEVLIGMTNHPAMIADFMTENSTSYNAKLESSANNYLGDPEDDNEIDRPEDTGKKNMQQIQGHIFTLGTRIVIDYEKAKDGEYFTDFG